MRNQRVYEVGDRLTSADVIHIATEVNNSDRQLSIMKTLIATTTAATVVQNPNVSELHVVKARQRKKGPATEDRIQATQARVSTNTVTAV